jgi:ATP-dependent DNA ligase
MIARPASLCQLAGVYAGTLPDGGLMQEEKIDGWRAVYLPDHTGRKRLFTRGGHPIEGVEHILHRLAQIERAAGEPIVVDGEFQVAGSLAATKAWCERGWKAGGEAGQLFAFDCLPLTEWRAGGTATPLYERKKRLVDLFAESAGDSWEWRPGSYGRDDKAPPVVLVEDSWCFDAGDVIAEARRVWARQGEGLMLKDPMSPYRRNRCDAWMKVKADNKWMRRAV